MQKNKEIESLQHAADGQVNEMMQAEYESRLSEMIAQNQIQVKEAYEVQMGESLGVIKAEAD